MPELIVAEKPSVARDLARVLGAKRRGKGCLYNTSYVITWCIGHLVELCEPHEYDPSWKRWSLPALPMLPAPFQLRPAARTRDHFEVVRGLLKRPDLTAVINACDAGREGELIFRYVMERAGCRLPVRRLWISSMTDEAIREGFQRLLPGEAYDPLYHAARCRSEADWLVGINATRAMTVRARSLSAHGNPSLLSVGRVQTPTLALMVQREQEIREFVPQDYWHLVADFDSTHGPYRGRWCRGKKERFSSAEEAEAMKAALSGETAIVHNVEQRQSREKAPLLYDLTHLQREGNKRFGMSAARVLEVAQSLYEKHKLLTYPRTDSRFLSEDMYPKVPATIRALSVGEFEPACAELMQRERLAKSKRVFNDARVTDHHAIIPTARTPQFKTLSGEEKRLYALVVRRFLAVFFPDAILSRSKITTLLGGETFVSKGKVVLEQGWRAVDPPPSRQRGQEKGKDKLLPAVKRGEKVGVKRLLTEQKQTKAPPRYTEATLLAAMEGAGKFVEEEELQQALKDSGIGTAATRASIIETLLARSYVQRQGKSLHPTVKGMRLIETLPVESLCSPQLTGEWEARLSKMARGEYSVAVFEDEVRTFVASIVHHIKTSETLGASMAHQAAEQARGFQLKKGVPAADKAVGYCPSCGGAVVEKERVFGCAGQDGKSRGCEFRIYKTVAKKKLTPTMVRKLLEKGRTNVLKGFTSRQNKKFEASLLLHPCGRVTFEFGGKKKRPRRPSERNSQRQEVRGCKPSQTRRPQPRPTTQMAATAKHQVRTQEREPALGTPLASCPRCEQGQIIRGRKAWGCNRWRQGCNVIIPYILLQRPFSESEALSLLEKRQTSPLAGFVNDVGENVEGVVRLVDAQDTLEVQVSTTKAK